MLRVPTPRGVIEGRNMSAIPLLLALSSPLLHARLRAELARDPGCVIAGDTNSAAGLVAEAVRLRPRVILVDRDMLLHPALASLPGLLRPLPAVVMVTVYKEGLPTGQRLPISGTLPFDARPGDIAAILTALLSAAAPAPAAPVPPPVLGMSRRFTLTPEMPEAKPATALPASTFAGKSPVPSKTSQLAKTGFLRSIFDPIPTSKETTDSKS